MENIAQYILEDTKDQIITGIWKTNNKFLDKVKNLTENKKLKYCINSMTFIEQERARGYYYIEN